MVYAGHKPFRGCWGTRADCLRLPELQDLTDPGGSKYLILTIIIMIPMVIMLIKIVMVIALVSIIIAAMIVVLVPMLLALLRLRTWCLKTTSTISHLLNLLWLLGSASLMIGYLDPFFYRPNAGLGPQLQPGRAFNARSRSCNEFWMLLLRSRVCKPFRGCLMLSKREGSIM